jgi:molecular chaperone GrpE
MAREQADLARRLLDALDDLQRVEHFDPAQVTTESLLQALELVERKFRTALESAGLEEIEAQGAPFNPEMMEALMTAPAESPEEDEVVLDVFQKGYRLGNMLVRPARVRVKKYEG